MLLDFLREHTAACPVCGYNLLGLTTPTCPECRQELVLTVGAQHPRFGWLLAALAPGFFSGIAAAFVLVPIVLRYVSNGGMSPALNALDLFGWCSGAVAITIATRRIRFIALPLATQRWWAIILWATHIVALVLFILFGRYYM